ncbi:VOC family protein [Lysinibacillus sphaericus]|uniref:Glyoxalase/bleomycin resistance protein/dioxygenase n=1 Tax=Lysinibacillus sphaericus OT4b.31 TaxID=1285586 RepID=R7Z8B0_LYSSH|nr:VOC family protein [Lysinibacillus sphaericus]EON70259.1 glyoxalase/bleomycin resistance protein/dioxygenase [Lysinibacillus sphaericus OT4b.31]
MVYQSQNIFINLPVKDLNKSTTFFKELGFKFNLQFTTEDTASMIISDNIFALLMLEERFKEFSKKKIVDTATSAQAIFCLSAESRDQVDALVNKALSSGGKSSSDPQDHGFMYVWGFQDVDGHLWEIAYMDVSAMNQG